MQRALRRPPWSPRSPFRPRPRPTSPSSPTPPPPARSPLRACASPTSATSASTVKVDLQLPHGFVFASYEPQIGWTREGDQGEARQAHPDRRRTDQRGGPPDHVHRPRPDGRIGPGQFMDFPLSVQIPGKAGDKLTFKALQTYSDGEVVRWIGAPDSDTPAPDRERHEARAPQPTADKHPRPRRPAAPTQRRRRRSKGLAMTALIVGALGLVAGLAASAPARGVKRAERSSC